MARLIHLIDGTPADKHPLESDRLSIGRAPDNDVQLDDQAVSGHHAVITRLKDGEQEVFELRDLDSTNGSYVNDQAVSVRRLQDRDVVRLGWSYFEFVDEQRDFARTTRIKKSWIPGVFINRD